MYSELFLKVMFGSIMSLALSTGAFASAKLQVIYNFAGGSGDGANPLGRLVMDGSGSLYGATANGGASNDGTIFKVSPRGHEKVLYAFKGMDGDGLQPFGGVILDKSGNLYGTTSGGGVNGLGVVFKLTSRGAETILHTFQGICCGNSDGSFPDSSLIADKDGYMYGTTQKGGNNSVDAGTVFRISADGTENVVHAFSGEDGAEPFIGGLALGADGLLYGATEWGGRENAGEAFRMTTTGAETELHGFGASDGHFPEGWVAVDDQGNMYGTTPAGGGSANDGVVYKIDTTGVQTTVHAFSGADGAKPLSVIRAGKNLYGVTASGGANGLGTVFKIARDGVLTTVYSFDGTDGANPMCPLLLQSGNLYGTTYGGGAHGNGIAFKLTLKKKKTG